MTRLFIFLLLFFSLNCFGQTKNYSENEIYKLFKKTISQTEKNKIKVLSNPWLICNKDSSYYLNDTIKIISNSYLTNSSKCCQYIAWTFYKKDNFIWTNLELCKEPTTASATKLTDHFKVLVLPADNYLVLSIFNNEKLVESFKIVNVQDSKQENTNLTSTTITLVRQRKIFDEKKTCHQHMVWQ